MALSRFLITAALLVLALGVTAARAGELLEVEISGIDGELLDNVRGYLAIEQSRGDDDLTPERIALMHRRAPRQVAEALAPFGYYRPETVAELAERDGRWIASYRIDPGEAMLITRVDVELLGEAADDPAFADLLAEFPVSEGAPLRHADYDRAREALERRATNRGYFDARLTRRELRIDRDAYTAAVYLTLDAGRRYRFGEVTFEQELLDEVFLRRFVPFSSGEPYLNARLLELQAALIDSNYYGDVQVTPHHDRAVDDRVPVVVTMTARPLHRYTAGIGYGTDTGMRGRAGWEWRAVNDKGHRMSAGLELAELREAAVVRYTVPVRNPRSEQLVFTGSWIEEDTDTSFSRTKKVGTALQLGRHRWRMTYSLDYKREESRVGSEDQKVDLVIPGVTWSRVYSSDGMHVGLGQRIDIDLHGGAQTLGSDVSFVQLRVGGKHIFSPWQHGRVIGRWDLGSTWTDDFDSLPVSERFFAGGDQSIRGYAWDSLGPTDSSGDVIGGRYLAVGSLEYEHYLSDKWGVAVFEDIGSAYDDTSDQVYRGRGVGLRWRSPIGTVRVDVARALDGSGEPWRLHLVIGPDL